MRHTLVCECKAKVECTSEDQKIGRVYQCPGCKKVWAHVRSKGGGSVWIEVRKLVAAQEQREIEEMKKLPGFGAWG